MTAFLPPSSIVAKVRCSAALRRTRRPVAVAPVNVIRSTRGCADNAGPALMPGTALSTPGGRTSLAISTRRRTVSGACSPGLMITVLPAASAGADFFVKWIGGQLNGRIAATTP